ncbi:pentapeptide repeat-containing protein [Parafrankia sp. BMG5.11]|uniref:pentapeptide repeat-containing protein n=1 Tax=Parafrankia sp. BMG5.11 TaxID=222540 RepID=UPI00103BB2D3|nr:pentapeptide repeat-containing protein [Parafrankia sp. BMG5.11]TCJ35234.1 pentapeptide repeat-containing protein [Parafrankia sp. BMG5.11]
MKRSVTVLGRPPTCDGVPRADLTGANLTDAWLINADLAGAQLTGATLTGARLDGTNLSTAMGLTAAQVAAARGDAWTRLPNDMQRPGSWPPYDPSVDLLVEGS